MVGRRRWRPHFSTSGTVGTAGSKTPPSRSSREQAGSHEVPTFGESGRNTGFISRARVAGNVVEVKREQESGGKLAQVGFYCWLDEMLYLKVTT